ncbi:MAG: DNA repair protein RecO [Clostridiales bacterium]|nr:DNA repair protein RecO [Clostridiales bacterium]
MSVFKARGIVIKEREAGEADKQLTLFVKDRGKITVSARGARKPKSKYLSGAQLFTYSDFIIYDGGRFFSLAQVDVIESFYELRTDYRRLCTANYMVEICDKIVLENLQADDVLHLLVISLSQLIKGKSPELAARAFEFKFFQMTGLEPIIDSCSVCGASLLGGLSFGAEGALCSKCEKHGFAPLSESSLKALRHISEADALSLFKFTLDEASLNQLKACARIFMKHNYDVSLKSLELLD